MCEKQEEVNQAPLLTAEEVRSYLRVSYQTFRRILRSGKMPYYRVGTCYRFTQQHIKQYLENVNGTG